MILVHIHLLLGHLLLHLSLVELLIVIRLLLLRLLTCKATLHWRHHRHSLILRDSVEVALVATAPIVRLLITTLVTLVVIVLATIS